MISTLLLFLAAAQPGAIPAPPPVTVRPGRAPEGTSPVPGSEVAQPVAVMMAGFDANGDGRTDRTELGAALDRTFAAADDDGDGLLGHLDYAGWAEAWLGSRTALPGAFAIDANGDDRLSRDEFRNAFAAEFARLDADKDGALTRAELLTVRSPHLAPVLDRNGRPLTPRERRDQR